MKASSEIRYRASQCLADHSAIAVGVDMRPLAIYMHCDPFVCMLAQLASGVSGIRAQILCTCVPSKLFRI